LTPHANPRTGSGASMKKNSSLAVALTIAGSDSGGGAGVQADLKTFAALEVHGVSAITCLTAQNPRRVIAVNPVGAVIVRRQLEAIFEGFPPRAAKTGMLYSAAVIREVVSFFRRHPQVPLVIDPVMVSTSGTALLRPDAAKTLLGKLLPLATLITPNLAEAGLLTGLPMRSPENLREAARQLSAQYGCAVLVKGGHLRGLNEALDILHDGGLEWMLTAPFVRGVKTHGTGCTYSAAITAWLARGLPLPDAVAEAKTYITQAIAGSRLAAGHSVLNHQPP